MLSLADRFVEMRQAAARRLGRPVIGLLALMSFILASALMASGARAAEELQIHFHGRVLAAGCLADVDSITQTIDFHDVRPSEETTTPTVIGTQAFDLRFDDCDGVDTISVSMSGQASTLSSDYFAMLDSTGADSGLGLKITTTGDGRLQSPDGSAVEWPLSAGTLAMRLGYTAEVIDTGAFSGNYGEAAALVDLTIQYQ